MAEEFYPIFSEPEYREFIRKLQDSDPASASAVFNPLFERLIENTAAVKKKADGAVPTTRKVNGKALSADITLTAEDVGAAASGHTHPAQTSVTGNAGTATKLKTARKIGSASFDGWQISHWRISARRHPGMPTPPQMLVRFLPPGR